MRIRVCVHFSTGQSVSCPKHLFYSLVFFCVWTFFIIKTIVPYSVLSPTQASCDISPIWDENTIIVPILHVTKLGLRKNTYRKET